MTVPKTIDDYIRMIDKNVETEWDERTRDLWYQIKEWLEELKELRKLKQQLAEIKQQERNKAIDDYFDKIEIVAFGSRKGLVHFKDVVLLREQLKGE